MLKHLKLKQVSDGAQILLLAVDTLGGRYYALMRGVTGVSKPTVAPLATGIGSPLYYGDGLGYDLLPCRYRQNRRRFLAPVVRAEGLG